MEALDREQRRLISADHVEVIKQRMQPAMYVLDASLNVVHFREDPDERRRACRLSHAGTRLPSAIAKSLQNLRVRRLEDIPRVWVIESSSLIVRSMTLESLETREPLVALMVERFSPRDYVRSIAARYNMSPRETQVLRLLLSGATNEEIAERLQIASSTAVFHVKRLMGKTGTRNRTELVAKAAF